MVSTYIGNYTLKSLTKVSYEGFWVVLQFILPFLVILLVVIGIYLLLRKLTGR